MRIIKVSTSFPEWPLVLQTPGGEGLWGDCRFIINDPSCTLCDAWIVYEDLVGEEEVRCPPEGRIFITGEPPFFSYEKGFLSQFSRIVTSHAFNHSGAIHEQQGLPWHIGRIQRPEGDLFIEDYDSLCTKEVPEKKMLLSAICSTKRKTPGQILRLRLVEYLKQRLKDRLELFGRGHHPIPCKGNAIFPARYHLVLENHDAPHYWSEKLADCYLGWSFPLYWGCRNLEEYFPSDSFVRIPAEDPEKACSIIEALLEEDPFESRLPSLKQSRELVLQTYNFFALASRLVASLPRAEPQKRRLLPRKYFRGWRRLCTWQT